MSVAVAAGAYLHHLEIGSSDPPALAIFYAHAVKMAAAPLHDLWLCHGPRRRMLFAQGRNNALHYAAFACRDAEALETLRSHIEKQNIPLLPSPSKLFDHRAFAVRDPDGNQTVYGLAPDGTAGNATTIHGPLQHVTLTSTDMAAFEDFYAGKLGFAVSDRVRNDQGQVTTCFLRSNHEHHTLAVFLKTEAGLDHHSYEAGEWTTIRDWADHLATLRVPIVWGPGRHGPGNNLFIFIKDPDGNMIEISAELEVVHDRPVKEWKHEPYTLNMWGPAIMRS
jgi:catechol 2,3-dioxygenase-like lactoylglutathione lyase family enzyme